jgi:hypothetical protein
MLEAPFRQFEIVMIDSGPQVPARAGPISTLVEHVPFGIIPVRYPAGFHRKLIHEFHVPEDLSVKVNVIDDVRIIRLCAALQQQSRELVAARMRWAVFFALADDTGERRITTVTGHEVSVYIGAMVEQQARDLHGILVCFRQIQPREA